MLHGIIWFTVGAFVGACAGVIAMALCVAARRGDEWPRG